MNRFHFIIIVIGVIFFSFKFTDWFVNQHKEFEFECNDAQCQHVKNELGGVIIMQSKDWVLFDAKLGSSIPDHCDLILIHNQPRSLKYWNDNMDDTKFFARSKQIKLIVLCVKSRKPDYKYLRKVLNK